MRGSTTTRLFVPRAIAESATGGTVVACPLAEGDAVATDQLIVEIATRSLDAEVLSPVAGTLVRLLATEGAIVRPGALLAEVETTPARPRAGRARGAAPGARPGRRPAGEGGGPARDPEPGPGPGPAAAAADLGGKPAPDAARPTQSGSAQYVVAHAAAAVAAVAAAGALVCPTAWLVMAAIAGFLRLGFSGVRPAGTAGGPADFVVIPARVIANAARRLGVAILKVGPLLKALAHVLLWLLLAVGISAAAGAVPWLVTEGSVGLAAAARAGAIGHGYALFAFLACFLTAKRALSKPAAQKWLRDSASGLSETGLTAAVIAGVAWLALCAVVLPRQATWPASSMHAVSASLPRPLGDLVLSGREAVAEYEAQAVIDCMAARGMSDWVTVTARRRDGAAVTLSVRPDRRHSVGSRALPTLMLALQNQLAGRVEDVAISASPSGARVRFAPLRTRRPVTDVTRLAAVATSSPAGAVHVRAIATSAAARPRPRPTLLGGGDLMSRHSADMVTA